MDPGQFTADTFGTPRRRPGDKWAFWHFEPAHIPRDLQLVPETVLALSKADLAVGQLEGLCKLITNPKLLIGPYLTREALASTRIEGTQASFAEVLEADAGHDDPTLWNDDIAEVAAYIRATWLGLELMESLPLAQRLILALHRELLQGVRGAERSPGEFRRSPVWIGSATDSPDTADFVPPLPESLGDLLADWENFVNESPTMPALVRCALMHYQFEIIHPFLDGNGRLGRLLIGLFLQQSGTLTSPLLYVSGYLESHRREYYERLQAVRERGEIQQWLQFFCTAVYQQSLDGIDRAGRLVQLREGYLQAAASARSRVRELLDLIFANPYLTVRRVETALGITNQGARKLIKEAEARGWVAPVASSGRRQYWRAEEVFGILAAPPLYERQRTAAAAEANLR